MASKKEGFTAEQAISWFQKHPGGPNPQAMKITDNLYPGAMGVGMDNQGNYFIYMPPKSDTGTWKIYGLDGQVRQVPDLNLIMDESGPSQVIK